MIGPLEGFLDYDFTRPHAFRDIRVIRTLEAKLVGELAYPVKPIYDMAKRTLVPLDMIFPTALFEEGGGPWRTTTGWRTGRAR